MSSWGPFSISSASSDRTNSVRNDFDEKKIIGKVFEARAKFQLEAIFRFFFEAQNGEEKKISTNYRLGSKKVAQNGFSRQDWEITPKWFFRVGSFFLQPGKWHRPLCRQFFFCLSPEWRFNQSFQGSWRLESLKICQDGNSLEWSEKDFEKLP